MSDYTKLVDFAGKDSLPTGNALKVIQGTEINDEFVAISTAVASKANLNGPVLTGLPQAPTAAVAIDTDQIATTAFVHDAILALDAGGVTSTAITNLIDGAPAGLNTLNELAAAIGDDASFSTTNTAALALKANIASPTFTGNMGAGGSIQAAGHISTSAAGISKWYAPTNNGNPEFYFGSSDTNRFGWQTVYESGGQVVDTVNFTTNSASNVAHKGKMTFSIDGSLRMTLNDSGQQIAGSILASGNITAYSDARLKSNVETIDNALAKVLRCRGVTFDMNDERGTGVIAQELEQVLPEAVFNNEETNLLSVAYGNVVGLLIEAIKEQQVQIETLMDMIGE